jgi:rSAM/selenodomain-associated transferase 1
LAIRVRCCRVIIAYTPREALQVLRDIVKQPIELMPQSDGDLGSRMNNAFKDLFARGYESAIIVGADLPTLPLSHLSAAFSALGRKSVVLGPCPDGGYYLIGLSAPRPELFEGIAWSTNQALGQTMARINRLGLEMRRLTPWYDVDTVDVLRQLRLLPQS